MGSSATGDPAAPPTDTLAQTERASLCELLVRVGPHAPTLAGGWDTFHLAAHLSLRESNVLDLVAGHRSLREGYVAGLLQRLRPGGSEQAVDDHVATSDYAELVDALRGGPPAGSLFRIPHVDEHANALEFFVHHEDVRRAQPDWTVRDLATWAQDELWSRIRVVAKVLMRRSPVGVDLARSDGADTATVAKGPDLVVVHGQPSELTLFAFGRSSVASVEFEGSSHAVAAVKNADFGI